MTDQRLGARAAAEYLGISPGTWRSYVARGQAPKPDGIDEGFGRAYWLTSKLKEWQDNRPGPGARTDLKKGH